MTASLALVQFGSLLFTQQGESRTSAHVTPPLKVHGEESLRGHCAESDDNFGFDRSDLTHQEWGASFAFFALGRPISRRTALNDVRDVHLFAAHPHRFDHVGEQLSRRAQQKVRLAGLRLRQGPRR